MERKGFLKSLIVGTIAAPSILEACKKTETASVIDTSGTGSVSSSGNGNNTCTTAPTETEGPFPTHTPSSYVRSDITDGKSGYKMTAKITIRNSA